MNKNHLYFDNAATTPLFESVKQEMTKVLQQTYGNPSSIHALGRESKSKIEEARKIIASQIKASTAEVFFTSGATESNNMAIQCAIRDLGVRRIISSPIEHHCVLDTLKVYEKRGSIELILLNVNAKGEVDLDEIRSYLQDSTTKSMLSLMHANNEIGTMIKLDEISALCVEENCLFHTDSVQSFTKFPIDVSQNKVSFLTGTAHKIHGPKGSGFLYVNGDNMVSSLIHGGSQERNMRPGTENLYGIVGFAKAVEEMSSMRDAYKSHVLNLRNHFKQALNNCLPGVKYNGVQEGEFLYTVLSINFPPHPYADLLAMNLDIEGICVSAGSACSSGVESRSHVLDEIQAPLDHKAIRFSFSCMNTKEEIDFAIEKIAKIYEIELVK